MTANDIVSALDKSPRHKDDFTMGQCKNGPSWTSSTMCIMDFVAIKKSWTTPTITAYEIKVSRGDFLSDTKWPQYMNYCDCFYFACPKGLITREDIEAIQVKGVGLVHVNPETGAVRTVVKALHRHIEYDPKFLMYIIMNKIEVPEEKELYPFHSSKLEYFKHWMKYKEQCHGMGEIIGTALAERVEELQRENSQVRSNNRAAREFHQEMREKYGVQSAWELGQLFPLMKRIEDFPGGYSGIKTVIDKIMGLKRELDTLQRIVE